MLEKYIRKEVNFREYVEVVQDYNYYPQEIDIDEDGFSNIRVFDPKRVKREHQMRENIAFYPFTEKQLLIADEPGIVDKTIVISNYRLSYPKLCKK